MNRTRLLRAVFRPSTLVAIVLAYFLITTVPPAMADVFDEGYLIVTTSELVSAFTPLAEYRAQQGYDAEVVTLEDILAITDPLEDDAATLRSYLASRHGESGIEFVLLGGDLELIPSRICQHSYPQAVVDYPSDLYFACFEGTWDGDGDGIYAEPEDAADHEPVLALGRAPVATAADVANFVAKVMAYEQNADGLRSRALLAASVIIPYIWNEGDPVTYDGAPACERIVPLLQSLPSSIQSIRMYQNHNAYEGAIPLTTPALLDSLSSGRYGLVDLLFRAAGDTIYPGDIYSSSDVFAQLGNGLNCPVAVAMFGSTAAFQDAGCVLVEGLNNPDGGFAAGLGFTAMPYIVPHERIRDRMFESFVDSGDPRLGSAWRDGVAWWDDPPPPPLLFVSRAFILLGDPAHMLWGDGSVSIEDDEQPDDLPPIAGSLVLEPNYPNPFNPRTTLAFSMNRSADVSLAIFDLRGRCVRHLVRGERPAGRHTESWNGLDDRGRAVPTGVYVYRVSANDQVRSRRMVLTR